MKIGAQFYTIREYCQTLDDFALSLQRVADIGYTTVQISGTCAYDPSWLKAQLDKTGLECVITHTPADRLTADPAQVAHDHDVFGCRYVGLGWYGFNAEKGESIDAFAAQYGSVAKALRNNGKYFMYHNHDQEFQKIDGKPILAHLAQRMSADEMGFTLDTFWIQAGGGDPAWWVEQLKGRLPCIHLKDYAYGRKMAVIGEGNINFERIFAKAQSSGVEYMLVEQDDCNGENPFDCLKRSYNYLRACGLE